MQKYLSFSNLNLHVHYSIIDRAAIGMHKDGVSAVLPVICIICNRVQGDFLIWSQVS